MIVNSIKFFKKNKHILIDSKILNLKIMALSAAFCFCLESEFFYELKFLDSKLVQVYEMRYRMK